MYNEQPQPAPATNPADAAHFSGRTWIPGDRPITFRQIAQQSAAQLTPLSVIAKMFRKSKGAIYRLMSRGEFPKPFYRAPAAGGGHILLWRMRDLRAWVAAGCPKANPEAPKENA